MLPGNSSVDSRSLPQTPLRLHQPQDGSAAGCLKSTPMQSVVSIIDRVARTSASILITGESGTGKEVVSRLIHQQSERSRRPLVSVNCAALAESLIESELFGHERGAFTGAEDRRVGKFEFANQATLLLDEISEIPLRLQAKLLRAIEELEIQRVGSNESVQLDVRILATSNRNLLEEVAAGRFRLDLFHRLSVIEINLPPLRERTTDIEPLAYHFLESYRTQGATVVRDFTPRALARLRQHPWPGNIRELRNVIHRVCLLATKPEIDDEDLQFLTAGSAERASESWDELSLDEIERRVILQAMARFDGNRNLAAKHLGISARTISNKLQAYRFAPKADAA